MGNRNILQGFPAYTLSKEAPDIDEILNNYDDLKKKVQVLQNITTGVFQYQGSRSLKVLVDDIKAYLANGGDNKYSKGCFYNINDLTGFDIKGLAVGDNIVFTGTIVTYADEIPVLYNSQTGMGNICGFEFDRFPSVVDLSEYLKTADADAKYALISDLNNIVTEMKNNIIQGGNIDSLTLDMPITDTSRVNKMYNVVRGQWNGDMYKAGGYHRFNYNCTMTNAKIINDNGSYYIQCNASDIPSELYYRQYGIFTLNNELTTFDITIDSYIYTFEYTSYSGDPPSEVLKFSLKNVQYGPKFSDDYYAQKFVDNIYNLGDIATVWAVDINVGDNFVITKNGFDSLVGNYATSGELNDLQNKLDTINKTLSGVYKNGGDVTEMTLDVSVSSSKINTMYNVKSGFVASGNYGQHGAFRYKITIKNAYIFKTTSDSGNTYELCFKLGDIPQELWYYSMGMVTFYGKFQNAIDYQPSGVGGWHFDFISPSELSISMTQDGLDQIIKLPYKTTYNGPTIDDYFSDKTFTDNKYQLGNIATIWYRNDISVDDNFVITEHGFDVLSYKITDYVSKSSFDSLSTTVAKKANSSDVYTKDDIREKAFISETVSNYPVVIPKDEMLTGEQYVDCRIYGNTDGFGTLNSSTNKYTINLTCRGKNLIRDLTALTIAGITVTKNDDGSVTLNGTATANYQRTTGVTGALPPGTYHLSGCPQGGSEDTYCIKIGTLGVDTGEGVTFINDTATARIATIYVKKGTTLDNVTFKPQIELGEVATGFEKWGQKSDITITLDTALGENDYADVINKKRYNGDGTVSNATVSGEMSVFDSDTNVIYCPMTTSPSKIEVSYYKDINTTLKALQSDIDGKANADDVYTKTEIDKKTADKYKAIPHTTVSGNLITITDALADEQPLEMRVYGDGIGDLNDGKYEIPVKITGKNLFDISKVNSFVARDYTTSKATYSSISDGVVTSKIGFYGTRVLWKDTKIKIPAGTYILSADCIADKDTGDKHINIGVWKFTTEKAIGDRIIELSAYKQWERLSTEITLDEESEVAIFIQGVGAAGDYTNLQIKIKNVQLEKGNTVTEYEPYQEHTATAILETPLSGSEYVDFVSKKRNGEMEITVNGDTTLFDGTNNITCQTAIAPSKMEMSYYQNINNVIEETDTALTALQADVSGLAGTGKYDTIIDYTYTGDETATELNILLTVEQLQKIKKYEKFFCYVTYNVSATTGTTSFWASAVLELCNKGSTTPINNMAIFMRAANTVQKITADNTPIKWLASTELIKLPFNNSHISNVLDFGATQYDLFNLSKFDGGRSMLVNNILYTISETNYDWVMQLKSPTAMPFVNGMKFIMWGK